MKKFLIITLTGLCLSPALTQTGKADAFKSRVPSQKKEVVKDTDVQLGIESVLKNKDGSYNISVYMLNTKPVAGYQMDIEPDDHVRLKTMQGGISEELGYMMKASENGKVLGFSMQGTTVPVSHSEDLNENIIFVLVADITAEKGEKFDITFSKTVIAGEKGVKLEAETYPYSFKMPKK